MPAPWAPTLELAKNLVAKPTCAQDKWRNMTTAVKKKTTQRGVKLTDEQRERIIKYA